MEETWTQSHTNFNNINNKSLVFLPKTNNFPIYTYLFLCFSNTENDR
jgi:hypothetical protein